MDAHARDLPPLPPHCHACTLRVAGSVPRVDGRALPSGEFLRRFMAGNRPVVLTGLMDTWRAVRDWRAEGGGPALERIREQFGASHVQVADCGEQEFTDQKRISMKVSEFIVYWEELNAWRQSTGSDDRDGRLLYLKDWHFVKEYPEYKAYTTPSFFSQDWLNEYSDHDEGEEKNNSESEGCSDYRFVYMGPKGTWTPLHADVLRSFSWSANVCGRKRWLLLPPEKTPLLFHKYSQRTVYNIESAVPSSQFPRFHETEWLECIQEEKEVIFVPSGWYHQVMNMEDTISINHNWLNACNIHWTWRLLREDYAEAEAAIADIRNIADDFEELCQRNLRANSGMNFSDFLSFLATFADRDLRALLSLLHSWTKSSQKCKLHLARNPNFCHIEDILSSKGEEEEFSQRDKCVVCSLGPEISQLMFNLHAVHSVLGAMNNVVGDMKVGTWKQIFDNTGLPFHNIVKPTSPSVISAVDAPRGIITSVNVDEDFEFSPEDDGLREDWEGMCSMLEKSDSQNSIVMLDLDKFLFKYKPCYTPTSCPNKRIDQQPGQLSLVQLRDLVDQGLTVIDQLLGEEFEGLRSELDELLETHRASFPND